MDIAAILRKANKAVTDLTIKVSGTISKKAPIEYVAIHIIYIFNGDAANEAAALAAVTASQEQYCGVSSMLKKIMPVTWEVHYNNNIIFNNSTKEVATLN
jgi:putative redox protein